MYINDNYDLWHKYGKHNGGVAGKCRCDRGDDDMTMTRARIFLERRLRRWRSVVVCCCKARRFVGKARLEGGKSRRSTAKARWSAIKICCGPDKVRWWSIKVWLWWWWWWRSDQVWSGYEGWCCRRWRVCDEPRSIRCSLKVRCRDKSCGTGGIVLNTHTHTQTHIRCCMLFIIYIFLLFNNILYIQIQCPNSVMRLNQRMTQTTA